jgi:GNAT superfamily N-acetyltransferase
MAAVTKGGTDFDPAALERTERRFYGEVFDAVPVAVAAAHGVRRADFGPVQATVVTTVPGVRALNLVLGAELPEAAAEGFLEEAIEWARTEGASAFVLLPEPTEGGADATGIDAAEAVLVAAGFERTVDWMRFVRDVHPPRFAVSDEVEVVAIDSVDESPFATVAALGFRLPARAASLLAPIPGLPDWRCYLALLDGEPQGCAALLLDGEVAELGFAATLESGRRRGCQLALLRRRIEDAAASGARTLFLETRARVPGRPSPSYANVLRAGFEEAYLCQGWSDARLSAG